jgi:hypothetical protein
MAWVQSMEGQVRGVNHCSLHCRLANPWFDVRLMYRVKYGAVVGLKKPIACIFRLGTYINRFPTNHGAVFDPRTFNRGISPNDSG